MKQSQETVPAAAVARLASPPPSRRYRLRTKLAALALGVAVGLVILEVAVRLIFPSPPDPYRAPQIVYQPDPELGYVHLPDQQGWIDDGLVTINSLGLRDTELSAKASDEWRVLVIGDSVTLGWGVSDQETYCWRLNEMLRQEDRTGQIRIVNGAVSGYDTTQEAAFLHRIGPVVDPDVVLIGFYWNDLLGPIRLDSTKKQSGEVLRMTPQHGWLRRTLRRSRALYIGHRCLWTWFSDGEWGTTQGAVLKGLLSGDETDQVTSAWRKVEAELRSIDDMARRNNWRVGILVLPSREQVAEPFPQARYQTNIREVAERLGWFVVDPLSRLADHTGGANELFIPYDQHHLSAAGHQAVAEELVQFAKKNRGALWPDD